MPSQWNPNHHAAYGAATERFTASEGRPGANGQYRTEPGFRPRGGRRQAEAERATRLALMDCYNG